MSKSEKEVEAPEPEAPAPRQGMTAMRVVGRDVEVKTAGGTAVYDRGDVISVDADQARELFKRGDAIPEDMRPEGAPVGVEKR